MVGRPEPRAYTPAVEAPSDDAVGRLLDGAELWARLDRQDSADRSVVLVAGWEDGSPGCAPLVALDGGLECRSCPIGLVGAVLRTGRPGTDRCPFGKIGRAHV